MNKFILAMLGLFVVILMMATMVTYASGNQLAFVKATIELSIDFGNVFPGMEVTESFTINSGDSADYKITLIASDGDEVLDIRPYLTVWKDASEFDETDGPVSGPPEYAGFGFFTSPDDLSDTWMVTLKVPNDTLPNDVGLDYACQISIEPTITPPPIPEEDLILRTNGIGLYTEFDLPAVGNHWEMLDDTDVHDGDITYISNTSNFKVDLYNIQDSELTPGTPIYKVTLIAVMKGNGTDKTNGFYGLRSGSNEYWGTRKSNLPLTYTYFSRAYSKNPATGLDWTVADIDALQIGFFVDEFEGSGLSATQIYIIVDITP
jgi:hypothetical protein